MRHHHVPVHEGVVAELAVELVLFAVSLDVLLEGNGSKVETRNVESQLSPKSAVKIEYNSNVGMTHDIKKILMLLA